MPAIRDGQNGLVVDTNEPRFSMGSGPVERRLVSPERMADIAAERVVIERGAVVKASAAAHPGPTSHWARKRAEKLPAISAALLTTSSYIEAAERLGMTRDALTQLIYQYRQDGVLPAAVDQLLQARASKQAAPQRAPKAVRTIEVQAPEAGVPATDADELGPTATGPAAEQVATPPAPTLPEYDVERPFDLNAQAIHRIGDVSHPIALGDSQVVDKPVSEGKNAPDDRGCLDQSNIGGAPMTVSRAAASAEDTYPQTSPRDSGGSWTSRATVAAAEALAFDHEHGRLYDALKVAEERAELAGDEAMRVELRTMRRRVARHLEDRSCAA